jgi:hypothetical protein
MGAALDTACLFCGRMSTETALVCPEDGPGGICLDCARSVVASFERAQVEETRCVVGGCPNTPEDGSAYCAEDRARLRSNPEDYV